jgi:hypothetical protein
MPNDIAVFKNAYADLYRQKKGSEKTQIAEMLTIANVNPLTDRRQANGDLHVTIPVAQLEQFGVVRDSKGKYTKDDLDRVFDDLSQLRISTPTGRFVVFQKYNYDRDNKKVEIKVDSEIADFFIDLNKKFGKIQLKIMFNDLTQFDARQLYFYLRPRLHQGKGSFKFKVSLKDFRGALGFEGFKGKGKKWQRYGNFKTKWLNPAIKELNKSSDISVSFTEIREFRRGVQELEFSIFENDKYIPALPMAMFEASEFSAELTSLLGQINFNGNKFIQGWVNKYSENLVIGALKHYLDDWCTSSRIKSKSGYLRRVLPQLIKREHDLAQKTKQLTGLVEKEKVAKAMAKTAQDEEDKTKKEAFERWKEKYPEELEKGLDLLRGIGGKYPAPDEVLETIYFNDWINPESETLPFGE